MKTERRLAVKSMLASLAGIAGLGFVARAESDPLAQTKHRSGNIQGKDNSPLFSGHTIHGNVVYIAGKGADLASTDIKKHTEFVLLELERELISAGSSMGKVLKVNVYLDDINNYDGMNEVYKGRFGKTPPVRTTVAVANGGLPGGSLVEMDCIAYI